MVDADTKDEFKYRDEILFHDKCRTPNCKKDRTRAVPARWEKHLAYYCSKACYESYLEENRKEAKRRCEEFLRKKATKQQP